MSPKPEQLATGEVMMPIPLADFISGTKVPVNLYVRLSEEKFVLLAKAGTVTQKEQLSSYGQKEVMYLWVKMEEYNRVAQHSIAIAGVVIAQKDVEISYKCAVLSSAINHIFSQLDQMGITLEMYSNAKTVTEVTVALCETHRDLASLFESLKKASDHFVAHSLAVSTLSVLVGQALGWEKKITLEKLALGGLLHDIGKKALPPDLFTKSLAEMSSEELAHYETHPYRGMQMLISLGIVPDDVISIVYEHHENSIGQGFPRRIRDVKIHPLAKVVALCNQFADLTMKNSNCPQPKSAREALMYIEHTMGQPFNKEVFRALKKVIEKENLLAA